MPRQRPPAEQAPRDSRIGEQERAIERLREELKRVERDRDRWKRRSERLERQRDDLERQRDQLEKQLAAARRAGFRQAAPFAKDRPQGHGGRPGRRAGTQYGKRGCRQRPAQVDEAHRAPVPAACPDCGGPLVVARVATQYQEDLRVVRPVVRRFDIEVGHCAHCRRRVQGRHRLQTSDALGAASVQLGPEAIALVVRLHTHLGMPLAKVAHLLQTQFGITVTPGGLSHVLHRTARQAGPSYAALCRQVRGSPVVTPDETGWRVGAVRHWLWAFATPKTTVYAIRSGRGFDDAATVLGPDFAGVLVRDGWAPYRRFSHALHQTCLAHLLRRARHLEADHPRSPWARRVRAVLQDALQLRNRRNAGYVSDHGLATVRGRLLARLRRLISKPPRLDAAERFAAHLAVEFPAVFAFLWDPSVDATNWRAEQAIRPAVVTRKVCGGNRTRRGADTQQVLASVVRTAHQRHLDLAPLILSILRSRRPAVPDALQQLPP